ncbi:tetratricopeptide repeat protein [Inediibacterium massiliense]|uniref:tetratricopeptide repeat protein n=1 Tax=Inediibacterium massiliense TaxID=1658111 RepID=UPI0006B3FCC6|nr:tetratricopeptide repeat protein [Inediibacterium massiliense]
MKLKKMICIIFCILYAFIFTACYSNENNHKKEDHKAYDYNQQGMKLMEEGKAKEAIEYFNKSLNSLSWYEEDFGKLSTTLEKSKDLFDSPLNNLSWAYNELKEYEKSLEYINLALKALPNSEEEYINKGNALFGLNQYEEALKSYKEALKKNSNSKYAYYGIGEIDFEKKKYKEALKSFNKYLEHENTDIDAARYKVYCLLNLEQKNEALNYANEWIKGNKEDYKSYELKEIVLQWVGEYEEIKNFYEQNAKKFSKNLSAQMKLGRFYYDAQQYNRSLEYFLNLLNRYPEHIDVYIWVMDNYSALGKYDKALEYSNKALKIDDQSDVLYNEIGNIYIDQTKYMESIQYFDQAMKKNKNNQDAYINKLYALYTGKRYSKCISFGRRAESKFRYVYNIPWFIGESYLELGQYKEAIEEYKKSLKLKPKNDEVLSKIAYAYLLLEDYKSSKEYVNKSLNINSENYTALYVKEALKEKEVSLGMQIKEFFDDQYLYKDSLQSVNHNILTKLDQKNISGKEISQVISKAKLQDDPFTFVIYGKDYDALMKTRDMDIEYKKYNKDVYYLRIKNFSMNTGNKVIEILDNIEDTKDKNLIIDLRENYGGDTKSANNILDALLPECVTSTLIYRDGYTYNYYSDASQILFKKIYIFVDENSASASELLTLGLKTYLKNVIVVGRNTFGKGVGQHVFEDKKNKIMFFAVSHYWNVRQKNIMNQYITPDIYVKEKDIKDFLRGAKIN